MTRLLNSQSQAQQDVFAYQRIGNLGTFIEIGAQWPIQDSNTYALEACHGWDGISLEIDPRFKPYWKDAHRTSPLYNEDARTFDYVRALTEHDLYVPDEQGIAHINYLSCDIEPPKQTLQALMRVVNQGITFDVITFEHDTYRCGDAGAKVDAAATKFLIDHGYKVAVSHVFWQKPENIFETWYVRADDPFRPCSYREWLERQN